MTSSSFQIPNHDSHWSIHAPLINWLIDDWWMAAAARWGVCCWYWWGMNALTLAESWCLVCGVTCILKESSKLAGWQAWLAGRLLRSAVVFAPMKQYGHVPSIVVWLIHGPWSYVSNKWLPDHDPSSWPLLILALDPSKRQSQSSPVPSRHTHPTRYDGGAQGIRTLLLQIMSLACSLYTTRPIRRIRDRCGGLEGRKANATTRARATDLEGH